jgi:hypothetical protein
MGRPCARGQTTGADQLREAWVGRLFHADVPAALKREPDARGRIHQRRQDDYASSLRPSAAKCHASLAPV